jgi:hypothetical protein
MIEALTISVAAVSWAVVVVIFLRMVNRWSRGVK